MRIGVTVLLAVNVIATVLMIDEPREPITPLNALITMAIDTGIVWWLWL